MTTPEDRPLEPGTIVANNYQVAERLGAGGMGTVYLANNVTLSQRVVVKVLRGSAQGAGQEEAQIMANLQHPNVVTVYAHDPSLDCIVMEFLDGASLSAVLEKGIDRVNAIRVALAVAEALAAVHRRGLVHRDIKPENVMLALNPSGGGRLVDWLKLIDFGLALKVGKLPPVLLGTPEFCGPEQFLATEVAHPANDVYALGITIFLMMTGAFPFDGPREELPQLHFHQPPPNLVEALINRFGKESFDPRTLALLEDLDELLQQMLAKRIEDRPTAQEVARRLTRLESSFAEAGTYVGTAASAVALIEQSATRRRRSGTSVLTPKHVAREPDNSSTSPDVQPVTLPSAPVLPSSRQKTELEPAPQRSNRGLIAVLLLVVAGLVAALVVLGQQAPGEEETPAAKVTTPPVPEVAPPPPAVKEAPDAAIAEAVAVVAPPDAGKVSDPEEEPTVLGVIKKPRPLAAKPPKPAAPTCRYDDSTEKAARKEMAQLSRAAPRAKRDEIEELGDPLTEGFRAKDCKMVEAVLKKMRAVAAAK